MEKYRFTCRRELHGFPLPMPEGEMFFGRDWDRPVGIEQAAAMLATLAKSYPLYSPQHQGNALRLNLSPKEVVILGYEPAAAGLPVDLWAAPQVISAVSA